MRSIMKKCENCNITYSDDKKFCKECGEPLIEIHQSDSGEVTQKALLGFSKLLQRNLKNIIGISILALISFSIYYFIFRNDPVKDANKILKAQYDCQEKYYDEIIKANNDFLSSFDQTDYLSAELAEFALKFFQEKANENFSKCSKEVLDKISEMKGMYDNGENSKKFSDVFLHADKSSIIGNITKLELSNKEVLDKINSIIPHNYIDKHPGRQDTMSKLDQKRILDQIETAVDPSKVPKFPIPNENK